MRAPLERGNLQLAGGTASEELRAMVEVLIKLFFIRKQALAMRAGLADLDAISLEVIYGFPEGYHIYASSKALTPDQDQAIVEEV